MSTPYGPTDGPAGGPVPPQPGLPQPGSSYLGPSYLGPAQPTTDAGTPVALPFHRVLTVGRPSRWWALLGVVMVAVVFLVAQTVAAVVIPALS